MLVAGPLINPLPNNLLVGVALPAPPPAPAPSASTPQIILLSPSFAISGAAASTLTVNGANFDPAAVVQFNGTARTTTFISSGQLQADISASDITAPGVATITVANPVNNGGTSAGSTLFVGSSPGTSTTGSGFAVTVLNQPANDIVYDTASNVILFSVPSSDPAHGNTISGLDLGTFPPVEPCSYELPQEITLFSFGLNKPLAGIGGGGMYFPDPTMSSRVNRFIKSKGLSRTPAWTAALNEAKSVIRVRARWASRRFAALIGPKRVDQPSSPVSLFSSAPFPALNHYHSEVAVARWRMRCDAMRDHAEYVAALRTEVLKLWSPLSVSMLPPTGDVPAMFTVRLPWRFRYSLSEALGAQGIQTTWHFYPLHRLASFRDYPREPMPVSDQLASELLVLPCQWVHTMLHLRISPQYLEAAMKRLMDDKDTLVSQKLVRAQKLIPVLRNDSVLHKVMGMCLGASRFRPSFPQLTQTYNVGFDDSAQAVHSISNLHPSYRNCRSRLRLDDRGSLPYSCGGRESVLA